MLEPPIKLEFYKKVEIYFKILRWQKKAKKTNNRELRNIWYREQQILHWLQGHHKMYREFELRELQSRVYGDDSKSVSNFLDAVNHLVEKELMEKMKNVGRSLYKFQPIAYLYSDVLVEINCSPWKIWHHIKYWLFLAIIWIMIVSIIIITVSSAYKVIFLS